MMKLVTFFSVALASSALYAKPVENMVFVGKSELYVVQDNQQLVQTQNMSDTIIYSGANFTVPAMKYGSMEIPSFTIANTVYNGDYGGVVWDSQTWKSEITDSSGKIKPVNGSDLKGEFTHADGVYRLSLSITFTYGNMPIPLSFSIVGYYVKAVTDKVSVMVGDTFGPYINDAVTYKTRIYEQDGEKKLDVAMGEYSLAGTVMGDLTLGEYTVKELSYDEAKGGFFRDYTSDGLSFHLTSSGGIDKTYTFKKGELFVKMNGNSIVYVKNSFQPGAMPFPIVAFFGSSDSSSVDEIFNEEQNNIKVKKYFENGMLIIERDGKKYNAAGVIVR